MSSLSPKDRVSLCLFTFADGRRCRTPRIPNHPYFCFFHAQKEARAQAAEKLGKDLACFFSGDYLSACDLSTALARLIPAVVRGDIKPKLARTVAYLAQTLMQAIHTSQLEYINAFGTDGWRKAVRTSVTTNYDYRFPPGLGDSAKNDAAPEPPQSPSTHPQPVQPAVSSPQAPARPQVSSPPAPPQPPSTARPSPADVEAAFSVARSAFPRRPNSAPAQLAALAANPSVNPPQPSASGSHSGTPSGQPSTSAPAASPRPRPQPASPNRDPYAVHFDHNYRLRTDGKLI
jgi:hypothetical protein